MSSQLVSVNFELANQSPKILEEIDVDFTRFHEYALSRPEPQGSGRSVILYKHMIFMYFKTIVIFKIFKISVKSPFSWLASPRFKKKHLKHKSND